LNLGLFPWHTACEILRRLETATLYRRHLLKLVGLAALGGPPTGDWKVKGVLRDPPFFYNPDLFWDAVELARLVKAGTPALLVRRGR